MACEVEGTLPDIHSKYEIKRTSYAKIDLEKLSALIEVNIYFRVFCL